MTNDVIVGQNPLPYDAQQEVSNMIAILGEKFDFKNGETAAFWHVCFTLANHLGEGKQ
jgi:hypothetical protein